jgi:hypothetical protein
MAMASGVHSSAGGAGINEAFNVFAPKNFRD